MPTPKHIKRAFAIRREKNKNQMPEVHAAGVGRTADQIIALARKNGIPINDDPDLVELLSRFDIEQDIPSDLYPLIGEILGFAYRLNDAVIENAQDEHIKDQS